MKDVKLIDLNMLAVSTDTGLVSQEIQGIVELDDPELLAEIAGGGIGIEISQIYCPNNGCPTGGAGGAGGGSGGEGA